MDQRTTFQNYTELQELLARLQGTSASFILDHEGLTRISGTITALTPAWDARQSGFVLDDGPAFLLEQVIAVNGIFRWDYTEC
ncbi:MAG TPA: hypothetical protein VGE66_08345 [Chitinophagaceae bacterium]